MADEDGKEQGEGKEGSGEGTAAAALEERLRKMEEKHEALRGENESLRNRLETALMDAGDDDGYGKPAGKPAPAREESAVSDEELDGLTLSQYHRKVIAKEREERADEIQKLRSELDKAKTEVATALTRGEGIRLLERFQDSHPDYDKYRERMRKTAIDLQLPMTKDALEKAYRIAKAEAEDEERAKVEKKEADRKREIRSLTERGSGVSPDATRAKPMGKDEAAEAAWSELMGGKDTLTPG